MNYSIEVREEPPADWNKFLLSSKTGTIFNTLEYAKYAPLEGYGPKFLRILDSSGNILLQNLLLEKNRMTNKVPRLVEKFLKKYKSMLRWNYGPVSDSMPAVMKFIDYLKTSRRAFYGLTHPLSEFNLNLSEQKWATILIELHRTKEELYNDIEKHSGQKNIERAIERDVVVEEITDKSVIEYLELFNKTKKERGSEETSVEQMEQFWSLLKSAGFSGFLAKKNGILVGGLLFSYYNKYINEWGVARSEEDSKQKLYAQDLIKWKIIEWGIENKMNWYDLSGFNPEPNSDKEKGIFRYKKKWGGSQYYQLIIRN